MHVYTSKDRTELRHVYLRGARPFAMTSPSSRRAHVVGVDSSVPRSPWRFAPVDGTSRDRLRRERRRPGSVDGLISGTEMTDDHQLVVVATPAGSVARVANDLLATWSRRPHRHRRRGRQGFDRLRCRQPTFLGDIRWPGRSCAVWTALATTSSRLHLGVDADRVHVHGYLQHAAPRPARDRGERRRVSANDHDRLVAIASHVHTCSRIFDERASEWRTRTRLVATAAVVSRHDAYRRGDPTMCPTCSSRTVSRSLRASSRSRRPAHVARGAQRRRSRRDRRESSLGGQRPAPTARSGVALRRPRVLTSEGERPTRRVGA